MAAPTDFALATLALAAGRSLRKARLSIATAESCTGGLIAKCLTDIAGSSDYFERGWVTYSNGAKHAELGVPEALLSRYGAVSEEVALAMARGALRKSTARVAIAVTGVAGPAGGTAAKPVGTVWIAWGLKREQGTVAYARRFRFRGGRNAVRRQAAAAALEGLPAS
jgi:nicotinamide-nucleotide amidase